MLRTLLLCLIASSYGAGAAATEVIVPLATDVTGLAELTQKAGAQAEVVTIEGNRARIEVTPGAPNVLHGARLDGDKSEVSVPFDSVALVYYTEPSASRRETRADRYPLLPNPGDVEKELGCAQLDAELARAEAVRWSLRSDGAMSSEPLRRQAPVEEQHRPKAGEVAAGVATVATAVLACAIGAIVGACDPIPEPRKADPAVRAVEAADQRIAGLLRLKTDKACAGRPTLQSGVTDLDIWSDLGKTPSDSSGRLLLAETAALDLLSPKPLTTPVYEVEWIPSLDHPFFRRDRAHLDYWTGSAQVASDELVINLHGHEREGQVSAEASVVRVPYAMIASTEYSFVGGGDPVVILWQRDGRYAAVRVAPEPDAKRMDGLASLAQLREAVDLEVGAEELTAAGASDSGTTYENAGVMRSSSLGNVEPRSAVILTERDLVFSGPNRIYHVPYTGLASAELNEGRSAVILTANEGPSIRVQLYGNVRLDRERMETFLNELHARMAAAPK